MSRQMREHEKKSEIFIIVYLIVMVVLKMLQKCVKSQVVSLFDLTNFHLECLFHSENK